jgi:hypothetical protein
MKSACYSGENQRQPARKTIMGEAEFAAQVQLAATESMMVGRFAARFLSANGRRGQT